MVAALRADFAAMFAIAAPFTLLVDMALVVFGPAPPRTIAGFTPIVVLQLMVLPGLVGAIALLAVAHMVALPDKAPRAALRAALVALPGYVGALLLSALPTGLGLLLFVVPGLYIAARLYLVVPLAVVERLGPLALLQRSWRLTEGHGLAIMLFFVLGMLFIFGAGLIAAGVGAALASVLTLAGLKSAGMFAAALATAAFSTVAAMGSAAASTVIYRKLNR